MTINKPPLLKTTGIKQYTSIQVLPTEEYPSAYHLNRHLRMLLLLNGFNVCNIRFRRIQYEESFLTVCDGKKIVSMISKFLTKRNVIEIEKNKKEILLFGIYYNKKDTVKFYTYIYKKSQHEVNKRNKVKHKNFLRIFFLQSDKLDKLYKKNIPTQRKITSKLRSEIFQRDNFTCVYCGKKNIPLCIDHFIPVKYGGTDDKENLRTSCFKCNSEKRDKIPKVFIVNLKNSVGKIK